MNLKEEGEEEEEEPCWNGGVWESKRRGCYGERSSEDWSSPSKELPCKTLRPPSISPPCTSGAPALSYSTPPMPSLPLPINLNRPSKYSNKITERVERRKKLEFVLVFVQLWLRCCESCDNYHILLATACFTLQTIFFFINLFGFVFIK